mmetsp:Transcript_15235/g.34113  ORF Transcript_15235/g.34113 Transcript_15235/m.34113 type:complete len:84 (-) Transcript_15235:10532-10783(-)
MYLICKKNIVVENDNNFKRSAMKCIFYIFCDFLQNEKNCEIYYTGIFLFLLNVWLKVRLDRGDQLSKKGVYTFEESTIIQVKL